MRFEGTDSYIATPDLMLAVNAALAGVVAFFTRSSLWTMGTGMAALWLLQAMG